ncbi:MULTISPECIES: D-alanyl-D-alanine carboxypeptidase family protein [unclassified Aureimonas]|uniref:D-alanyl-D-alanine carboxypeptidase family protein n=1 Tax=unclassified Aureimonas TaxID=2615206 RepID=UPI0006F77D30|nr:MULTISPECIES: D-alanyl-D-alanine carboxypeptidase family protein [unclassified Aureimonas]KQT53923.1 D-alanyl-D-alanine carboxypeptidase [Aureimonas sp. Leaf427]KQT71637.1 D-alanyl-D-alanine carboxypeptidase [Aureimonas sp. Leaf460]
MKAIRLARRCTAVLFAAGLAASALSAARAETSIVVDVATGAVLSQKDATKRWYPASTTKLMTTYVALKAVSEGRAGLDTPVVMTRYAATQAPSKMGFEPGSVMRLDNALRMLMVKSANDVAVAIGTALGDGSVETFVEKMNAEAAALGMKDSHFVNPHGLPGAGQYSSAHDLALVAAALRRDFPAFSDYFSTEAIKVGDAVINNHNGLLGRFEGADGMKTGYICASGFNLVGSATRDGRTLVAVVLGADGTAVRDRHAAELLEEGFKATPGSGSMKLSDMPVGGGEVADISERMCSPAGRTARAKEAKAEEEAEAAAAAKGPAAVEKRSQLAQLQRPRSVVQVGLGGAAGTSKVAPGISLIAAYGLPIPTFRPPQPDDAAHAAAAELRAAAEPQTIASSAPPVDLGVTRRGIPVPTPRVAN